MTSIITIVALALCAGLPLLALASAQRITAAAREAAAAERAQLAERESYVEWKEAQLLARERQLYSTGA